MTPSHLCPYIFKAGYHFVAHAVPKLMVTLLSRLPHEPPDIQGKACHSFKYPAIYHSKPHGHFPEWVAREVALWIHFLLSLFYQVQTSKLGVECPTWPCHVTWPSGLSLVYPSNLKFCQNFASSLAFWNFGIATVSIPLPVLFSLPPSPLLSPSPAKLLFKPKNSVHFP